MKKLLKILRRMARWFGRAEDRLVAYSLDELRDGDVMEGARVAEVAVRLAQVRAAMDGLVASLADGAVMYDSGREVVLTGAGNEGVN